MLIRIISYKRKEPKKSFCKKFINLYLGNIHTQIHTHTHTYSFIFFFSHQKSLTSHERLWVLFNILSIHHTQYTKNHLFVGNLLYILLLFHQHKRTMFFFCCKCGVFVCVYVCGSDGYNFYIILYFERLLSVTE